MRKLYNIFCPNVRREAKSLKYVIRATKANEKLQTSPSSSTTFHQRGWCIFNETKFLVDETLFPSISRALKHFIDKIGTVEGMKEITIETEAKLESEK